RRAVFVGFYLGDSASPEISTLSLHDARPIWEGVAGDAGVAVARAGADVEAAVGGVGLEVDARARAGVVGAAGRVRGGERGRGRVVGGDHVCTPVAERAAVVVGAGEGVHVTAG